MRDTESARTTPEPHHGTRHETSIDDRLLWRRAVKSKRGWTLLILGDPGTPARRLYIPRWVIALPVALPMLLFASGAWGANLLAPGDGRAFAAPPVAMAVVAMAAPELPGPVEGDPRPGDQGDFGGNFGGEVDGELEEDVASAPDDGGAPYHPGRRVRCSGKRVPDRTGFDGKVALTFDDGPHAEGTPRVVEILRRHEVPAAFFINGEAVDETTRPILADIAADANFIVGNHSWSHIDLAALELAEVRAEVDRTTEVLTDLGVVPRYFRFPFGRATCEAGAVVRGRGYRVTGWHANSADWCYSEHGGHCRRRRYQYVPDEMRRDMTAFVLRQVRRRNGGVVLFHDRLRFTADHLEAIIETLRGEGYSFTRLDDLEAFPKLNGRRPAGETTT